MGEIDKKIRNNFFIVIGINILALSLFFSLLYLAGDVGNSEMASSISSLRDLENMQSNFSSYSRAIEETEKERELLDIFIINKKTAAGLIGEIENLANRTGVSITKTVSVEKQPAQPKENMLRFGVRVKGSASDVFYFMTLLENMPYKLRFKSLSMGMSDEASSFDSKNYSTKGPLWAGETTFEVLSYINE